MYILRIALILILTISTAHSQVFDSSFFDWSIYEINQEKESDKMCYMISYAANTDSNHNTRKQPYIMITKYQKTGEEEISIYSGFEYKKNGHLTVLVDHKQFTLKTKKDLAWSPSKIDDANLIESMLNGSMLKVRSDSSFGTYAIDEYSLKGVARAYSRIRAMCE